MEQDLQTILNAVEQLRSETNANFGAVRTQLNTVETRLGTVETRLSTVEHGVLTIAQKLLADAEVDELRAKMRKVG
jgi:hypothetical protein